MLFPPVKQSFKKIKFATKKGNYIYLYDNAGIADFSNKIYNVTFKEGEEFDGDITIDGKPLAEVKSFYLPDLSGEDMSQVARLSGGKNPGKPFKKLNFDELCELFPGIRGCDVLLLDCAGIKLEPRQEIAIIDIYPEVTRKKYSRFCHISLEKEGYIISREKERRELPADNLPEDIEE